MSPEASPAVVSHTPETMPIPKNDSSRSLSLDEEQNLIRSSQDGDMDAFKKLYGAHYDRVFSYAFGKTNDPELAEDVTGQTFLNALTAIERYECRGARYSAYLFRIAKNLITNERRVRKRISNYGIQFQSDTDGFRRGYDVEQIVENRERARALRLALNQLKPRQKRVLVERFFYELSFPEIAGLNETSVGAEVSLKHRALQNLRKIVESGSSPALQTAQST